MQTSTQALTKQLQTKSNRVITMQRRPKPLMRLTNQPCSLTFTIITRTILSFHPLTDFISALSRPLTTAGTPYLGAISTTRVTPITTGSSRPKITLTSRSSHQSQIRSSSSSSRTARLQLQLWVHKLRPQLEWASRGWQPLTIKIWHRPRVCFTQLMGDSSVIQLLPPHITTCHRLFISP